DKGKVEAIPKGARMVPSIPGQFYRMIERIGAGRRYGYYELVPKLAYVAVMNADLLNGSDYQTVLMKLENAGPTFTARPLPIVQGARVGKSGIIFKKHPEFSEVVLVEGDEAKRVQKYLPRALRDALLGLPEAWLHVDGHTMALTLYGPPDASKLRELVETADI